MRYIPFKIRRVVGSSMEPALAEGTIVVVHTWKKPKKDHVVMARVNDREIIKRIVKIEDDICLIYGDNELLSADSRQFGPIPINDVVGVVFTL